MILVGLLALAVAAVGAFGAYRWARRERRALWAVVPLRGGRLVRSQTRARALG